MLVAHRSIVPSLSLQAVCGGVCQLVQTPSHAPPCPQLHTAILLAHIQASCKSTAVFNSSVTSTLVATFVERHILFVRLVNDVKAQMLLGTKITAGKWPVLEGATLAFLLPFIVLSTGRRLFLFETRRDRPTSVYLAHDWCTPNHICSIT